MTAAPAETIQFEAVCLNREAVTGRDFFLEPLDVTIFKFDNFPATGANEMIVMALMRDIVVLGLSAEVPGLGQSGFTEQIERAVDCGQSEMRIFLGELVVHFFSGDMFLPEEGVEDELTLTSKLELVLPEMLFERLHLLHMF